MPDGDTFDPGSTLARLRQPDAPIQLASSAPSAPVASAPAAPPTADPREQIVTEFTGAGYPKHVAEGIARRAGFEGAGDPAKLGDGFTSMGLFQEHGPRMQALLTYAQKTGQNPLDPKTQIRFAQTEIAQNPAMKTRLMNAKTREEAYDIFTKEFENPKNPNDHGPGGLNLPATGELPPWMKNGGGDEENVFREMRAKQFGATQSAMEHLGLARSAEAKMLETAPKSQPTQPAEQWSSMAMAVAALGGLLTHTPLTTSMNAMAGALNAFKENDKERAAQQFQEWKASHDTAIKMADMEIKQYEAAIKQAGAAPREAQAQMAALTASFKNDFANRLWNEGRYDEALAVHAGQRISMANMGNAGKNFEAQAMLAVANQVRADHPEWNDAQVYIEAEKQMHGAKQGGALEKDSVKRMLQMEHPDWEEGKLNVEADKVLAGAKKGPAKDVAPATPEERESAAAQASTGMPITQIIPGYGQGAVAARQQVRNDAITQIMQETGKSAGDAGIELANRTIEFQSGKKSSGQLTTMRGATFQAVEQLDFNIDKAKAEMAKLPSSDLSPVINAIARGEERWTGEPAYSSLFYYMHAVAAESARILSGGQASVAQLHVGAMEEAQKWANVGMTPASFDAVARAMKDEGHYRLKTFDDALKAQRVGEHPPTDGPQKVPEIATESIYNDLPPGAWYRKPRDPPDSHRVKP